MYKPGKNKGAMAGEGRRNREGNNRIKVIWREEMEKNGYVLIREGERDKEGWRRAKQ